MIIALFALGVLSDRSILRDRIIDLRYSPLSPTAAPMIVHQNSVCVSLHVVGLSLILGGLNHGISDSLLTVSMQTVGLV
jgi:hypothetical protein